MSIVNIAFRNQEAAAREGQRGSGSRGGRRGRIFLLAAAGLLLGMTLGVILSRLARVILALEPLARFAMIGGGVFLTAGACFILSFNRAERRHELALAGYEEKQRFYYGLLDSLFAALDGFQQGNKNPAEEVLIYLQGSRTEFYTYAGGKVIAAADAWVKEAEALSNQGAGSEDRDFSLLRKRGKAVINAIKEDLCQQGVEYAGESIFSLLASPAGAPPLLRRLK